MALGMVTYDRSGSAGPDTPAPGFLSRTIFNTSHQVIGLRYLWLALGSVLFGMLFSLLMRIHLVWPAVQIPLLSGFGGSAERYTALTMLHGSLMVFLVLTTAPQAGFGNYFLPLQIGTRELAFPVMNLVSFWGTRYLACWDEYGVFCAPQCRTNALDRQRCTLLSGWFVDGA